MSLGHLAFLATPRNGSQRIGPTNPVYGEFPVAKGNRARFLHTSKNQRIQPQLQPKTCVDERMLTDIDACKGLRFAVRMPVPSVIDIKLTYIPLLLTGDKYDLTPTVYTREEFRTNWGEVENPSHGST